MKRFIVLSVAAMLLASASVKAQSTMLENFNSWPLGAPADNTTSTWGYKPFGNELTGSTILTKGGGDHYLQLSYDSPTDGGSLIIGGTGPFASLGLSQATAFTPVGNMTSPTAKIEFDLRSSAEISGVFSVEILAEALFLDDTPTGEGQVGFRLGFAKMLGLPGNAWTHFDVLVSDLTTYSPDQGVTSKKPNLANITGIQLLVLQTDADLTGIGTIDIDNLAATVPEPGAMMLFGFAGLLGLIKKKMLKK